jgi:hypothetical protein
MKVHLSECASAVYSTLNTIFTAKTQSSQRAYLQKQFKESAEQIIPAKAGYSNPLILDELDPRFRGNDGLDHP